MTIRVANAPCSWGALEFDEGATGGGEGATAAQVLDEMAGAGFAGTELGDWGFLPTEPGALAAELGRRSLALVGAFVPVGLADEAAHEAGVAAAVRTATLIAAAGEAPFVVLADDNGSVPARVERAGRIAAADGLGEAAWDVFAAGAERVARAVRDETGLRTVFHHHCAGWVETPDEAAALLERTDPGLLGLCLDTGHWTFGGGDAVEALERWGERVWHVHFKDCDPYVAARSAAEGRDYFASVGEGVFCELGRGSVDFRAVTENLRARGYAGWIVVEQDVLPGMGTPRESAERNRAYLRELGL